VSSTLLKIIQIQSYFGGRHRAVVRWHYWK